MSAQQQQPHLSYGVVKQVLSGDSVIIRGQPRGGPPKERVIGLSNIIAPRLARAANINQEGSQDAKDEPFAWEAREFLRKKLIGKEVCFTAEKPPNSTKEYGAVYLGRDTTAENITESLVMEGYADVRRTAIKSNEFHQKLCELEDNAKASRIGKHGQNASHFVRNVKWSIESPLQFVESLHQKPVKAIVEQVRDGSTVRLVLLPDVPYSPTTPYYYITLMLSGIRCPALATTEKPEAGPFSEEAKFFTECRLLQREVEVVLESVSNQCFLGTVLHPNGNITELLLLEGFARCVDWSIQFVITGPEKLRTAERQAKEKRLRLWKTYTPSGPTIDAKEKEFQGKVIEIMNCDALMVKLADGSVKKIFLSSIRPPRLDNKPDAIKDQEPIKDKPRIRPLYDIPYMFEGREFLRKKLIGKKVNVTVDYKQPPANEYLEKVCCTVTSGGVNVAEVLVSKGLATVVRYRAGNDQRSSHYDQLLAAETKAQKSGKGLHCKKDTPPHRVVDLSGDLAKSKQFLPFLNRAGHMEAVVEFVVSGSRLRLYVPRKNCLLTFLLAGISCQKAGRTDGRGTFKGDSWGDEALAYTKDLCMQREVEIEVESMDKAGNFIGWLWIDNVNLSISLVREGYAEVHGSAEKSPHYRLLQQAESDAKSRNCRMWENHAPVENETKEVEEKERKFDPKRVEITEVRPDLTFYVQHHEDGPKLVEMLQQLRLDFSNNVPLPGAYVPKKNDICASKFTEDGMWYRAKVEKVDGKCAHVSYMDYGNRETISITNLAALPLTYQSLPAAAHEYGLAFVSLPKDPDNIYDARRAFEDAVCNTALLLNVEYKVGSTKHVTLITADEKAKDIGRELVENGFLIAEKRKEKYFQKVVHDYLASQDLAKKNRLNLWCYGDITEDDAKEFG